MSSVSLTIDGHAVQIAPGGTVLAAARVLGIDIPTLCYLEKCGPLNSCQVCLVKINGRLVPACGTPAQAGMVIESETDEVHEARRTALELLFSEHVGDCLSPCQRLCPLGMNIPVMIRQLQAGDRPAAAATVRAALPLAGVLGRLCHHPCEQGCRRGTADEPASIREMERFAADWEPTPPAATTGEEAAAPPAPGARRVVIVGAGPAGLAAAWHLNRAGYACTVADRHPTPGGSLRAEVESGNLPGTVLEAEIALLRRAGVVFQPGLELGDDLTLDGLLLGFDAVLVTVGEMSKAEGEALGLAMAPGGVRVEADTYVTSRRAVFAAGRAVRPMTQVLRAVGEGRAAAEIVHQFLTDQDLKRPGKPFSSIMGRLDKAEIQTFLGTASPAPAQSPCDVCSGFNQGEAAAAAARCLRCDCRSSGQCALQSYAEDYGADASRYRQQRRPFEQFSQPGGVIFEPGKCILCGICVKLTELAGEPLGLAFVGRGFDVRVAAPFDRAVQDGLKGVAEECVRHCPTGALAFHHGIKPPPPPA